MKKFFASILLFSLALVLAPSANALNSAVYFEGGADNFVFYPGTDLFDGFKGAMPGDTFTESVKVKNTATEYDYVKIYLRAEAHSDLNPPSETDEAVASMNDYLAQLKMRVYNGDTLIYDASPDQPDGLNSNTLLGEFAPNTGTTLTVELEVPKTLGSEYMHRSGEVDWIFTAEGYVNGEPVDPDPGDNPGGNTEPEPLPDEYQNGNTPFTFDAIVKYALTFGLCLIGLIVAIKIIRRQIKQNKQA